MISVIKKNTISSFEEFWRLYQKQYGDCGPSISSSCGRGRIRRFLYSATRFMREGFGCGCWKCHLDELREWKKSQ